MTRKEAEEKIKKIINLPAGYRSVSEILKLINNEDVSISEIAEVISRDQSLTAKILKLVNSGFYGFNRKISSVSHAIALLGVNIIRSLILSSSILKKEDKLDESLIIHSLATAQCSGIIAEVINLANPEELIINGLLHDIGKIILKNYFTTEFEYIQKEINKNNCSFYEAEKKHFDFNHTDLGGWILQYWNLPESIQLPVKFHHDLQMNQIFSRETAVVQYADSLVREKNVGSGWDNQIPEVSENAKKLLDLSQKDIDYISTKIESEVSKIII